MRRPLLVDPNAMSDDGTVAMTAVRVSPGGDYLAYALAEAGSDWRTIHVLDIDTGAGRDELLHWTKWIDPTWLPDGSGFLYWRYPAPTGQEFTEAMGAGELLLHRLGDPAGADEVVWARPADHEWMADPWVSADGRWLVLSASPGTDSRSTIEAHRLVADDDGSCRIDDDPVIVVGELADAHHVVATVGDTLYLRTERDAPRGRLVAVDLADARRTLDRDRRPARRRRAGGRPARRRGVRVAVVDRRGAPGRDRRPDRGPPRLARPAGADLDHRAELPSAEQRDLPRGHVFHPPGQELPDRCRRARAARRPVTGVRAARSTCPKWFSSAPAASRRTALRSR